MNKINLLKLFLSFKKHSNKGISLTELLVALVMTGIVLTAATSGFINLLRVNKDVESKTVTSEGLAKALNFTQEEIKQAKTVTQEAQGTNCDSSAISSANCLVLTYPASFNTSLNSSCTSTTVEPKVYYGFQDISSGSQIWLKPGVLKRKIFCSDSGGTAVSTNWIVIADGLISVNEPDPGTTCSRPDVGLTGTTPPIAVYGANASGKGGFRFCFNNETTTNRLAKIFLYGYTGKNSTPTSLNITTFARAQ
jgi:Tfp pilus assembly protein FimT